MMPSLRVHRLSFAHNDAVALLDAADLHLSAGWTGLVGENGAGKTTLLRLLAGELRADAGQVRCEPPSAAIVVCPQTVEHLTLEIERFAERSDAVARRLAGEIELDGGDLQRWSTLSPGERKRWQMSRQITWICPRSSASRRRSSSTRGRSCSSRTTARGPAPARARGGRSRAAAWRSRPDRSRSVRDQITLSTTAKPALPTSTAPTRDTKSRNVSPCTR